jgi:hypothetical protein
MSLRFDYILVIIATMTAPERDEGIMMIFSIDYFISKNVTCDRGICY